MSATYIIIDRKTPMLLPPDLREWVASDDMVHFVIEAVEGLPTKHFAANRRGTEDVFQAEENRGAGFRHHQACPGISTVSAARAWARERGVGTCLSGVQHEAVISIENGLRQVREAVYRRNITLESRFFVRRIVVGTVIS